MRPTEDFRVIHQPNGFVRRNAPYGVDQRAILRHERFVQARDEIATWPDYEPTPLVSLPGLATELGLGKVLYKDEGFRFGLKSFKALGGAYAVFCLINDNLLQLGVGPARSSELRAGAHAALTSKMTFAAATDGNHGRSVAWGAKLFGCECVIYLHEKVSQVREDEIASYGARTVRISDGYDNSVRQCAADSLLNGWHLVADTSANTTAVAPSLVMQGYTVLVGELLEQAGNERLTHIFVPGAVGGLAAATVGHLWETAGPQRPRIVVVQAESADCIARSIRAGSMVTVPGDPDTFMACLAAAEVSPAAWDILQWGLDDVVTIPDDAARDAMRWLAAGLRGDRPIVAGESGCAAAAGLAAVARHRDLSEALQLRADSVVAVVGSEGATDAAVYLATVGRPAEDVLRIARQSPSLDTRTSR